MAERLQMIALSPTMEEGTIVNWTKKEGDTISSGDVICEVETDKATMEYESIQEGTLLKIVVGDGGSAKVEQTIGIVGEKGEDVSDLLAEIEKEGESETPKQEKKAESAPTQDQQGSAPAPAKPAAASPPPSPAPTRAPGERVKASPLARAMASERGYDIAQIQGSGPGGRVVKRDVENYTGAPRPVAAGIASPSYASSAGQDQVISLTNKRKVIAQRLQESKFTAPHFYLKLAIDTEPLMAARADLNGKLKDRKVSVNAFIIKYVAEALKRHPQVNASWQGDSILQFGRVDVGLAVAQDDGLITPVVRDAGSKGILAIDDDLKDLIPRAQNNKLQPEEFTGATFTISSLGSFGIEEFTAIINPPGSAILAVGSMQRVPVVDEDDDIVIRTQMKVTLSCDHRVIDGAVGAKFMTTLKEIFENPGSVLY